MGAIASQRPKNELIFPSSFVGTNFDVIDRMAIEEVPFKSSTRAPIKGKL